MLKRNLIFLCAIVAFGLIGAVSAQESNEDVSIANSTTVSEISLLNFLPTETEIGDVQFRMQIKNEGNQTINNLIAFISGDGFSSRDIIPIDSLAPGEKSYLFVYGKFEKSGNISLTVRIDRETFYKNIIVKNSNEQILTDTEKELENLSQQLTELKSKYVSLEFEISEKKDNNYDVSNIDLGDLKEYIRSAEANVFDKDLKKANSNLKLAVEEYNYQKNKIENAKLVPILSKIKDNALLFSAIAGSILAFFAIYELLIRKGLGLAKFGKNIVSRKLKSEKVLTETNVPRPKINRTKKDIRHA